MSIYNAFYRSANSILSSTIGYIENISFEIANDRVKVVPILPAVNNVDRLII